MHKNKSHNGLLKRIRVTKSGKVKFRRPGGRHLKSHKCSAKVQSYRKPRYARSADIGRLRQMLHLRVIGEETIVDKPVARDDAAK